MAEGHTGCIASARCRRVSRGQRPRARTETLRTRTGRSWVRPPPMAWRDASGSLRTYADDERTQEVGQSRSTDEVAEQGRATGGGGGGGKGTGQGEPAPAKRASDSVPARRAQCAGASTSGSNAPPWRHYLRQEPDAVVPHVRIRGGGREQSRSLLRLPAMPRRRGRGAAGRDPRPTAVQWGAVR